MYRHFAVVTVALTAGLAMFADGERRGAMAEELEAREQRQRLEIASQEKFGKPKLVKRNPQATAGSFGDDGGAFGEPSDDTGGYGGGIVPEDFAPPLAFAPAAYNLFGLTDAEWAGLTAEQRADLRRQALAEAEEANSDLRRGQIAALRQASASRAGTGAAAN